MNARLVVGILLKNLAVDFVIAGSALSASSCMVSSLSVNHRNIIRVWPNPYYMIDHESR
jgi:hypothetical protein